MSYTAVGTASVSVENVDGDPAADKLFEKCMEEVDSDDVDIGFLFCSESFDLEALVGRLGYHVQEHGGQLVGGTTAGELSVEGPSTGSAVLLLVSSDEIEFSTVKEEELYVDPVATGRKVSGKLSNSGFFDTEKNTALHAIVPGFTTERQAVEFHVLKGLLKNLDASMPIAGGSTADDMAMKNSYQFYGQDVYEDAAVMTGIRTDLEIVTGQEHGMNEKVATGVVTDADGNVINEISGKPAAQWYADAIDEDLEDLKGTFENAAGTEVQNIFVHALEYTLGVEQGTDNLRVVTPVSITEDDGLYETAGVSENSNIFVVTGKDQDIVEAAKDSFKDTEDFQTVFSIINDCAVRNAALEDDQKEKEIDQLREKIGENFIGYYGYGEIGGQDRYCTFNNQTVSGLMVARPE
ncbi:MAG: FIST signal transduction protein [Candidatus Nanohaloarchaea archaeon]